MKNTRIPVKTPILTLIKKRIYSEDDFEKPRGQFPYSPKVSFPCSLQHLIWVCAVCTSLSVPIFRFFKFLIPACFVCISDKKRLYKMFVFIPKRFPPRFHVTYHYEHEVSKCGARGMLLCDCSFSGFFNNYNVRNIYIM